MINKKKLLLLAICMGTAYSLTGNIYTAEAWTSQTYTDANLGSRAVITNTPLNDGAATASGRGNIAIGNQATANTSSGNGGVISIGTAAGKNNNGKVQTTDQINIGDTAGVNNVGIRNIAIGGASGQNVSGNENIAMGYNSLYGVSSGENIGIGLYTLQNNKNTTNSSLGFWGTGHSTAIGSGALNGVTGGANTAIGSNAGRYTTGDGNFYGGLLAGASVTSSTTSVMIGNQVALGSAGTYTSAVLLGNAANIGLSGTFDGVVGIGDQTQAIAAKSVALGAKSVSDRDALSSVTSSSVVSSSDAANNTVYGNDLATSDEKTAIADTVKGSYGAVSVGNSTGTRQIINVAAGSNDSDAVNVSQLKAVSGSVDRLDNHVNEIDNHVNILDNHVNVLDGRVNVLNNRVDVLNNRVNTLDKRIDKVGAGSAALSGLHPLDFDPDNKFNVAVSGGFYRSEQALAVGAFYHPNEETMFSVASTVGNTDNMVNIGASFKLGQTTTERKFKEQYKTAPISTVYVLENEVSQLKTQHDSDQKEIANLKATVQQLVNKVGL